MPPRSVCVIGGGPAGLFAATLLKLADPAASVVLHERSVPDDTFGFGVAFTRRTLEMLAAADTRVVDRLRDASVEMPPQEMRVGPHSVRSAGNGGGLCIARSALLTALLDEARDAGVRVELGSEIGLDDARRSDLVIAADGVGSTVRASMPDEFGEHSEYGRGLFMWLGCDRRLESNLFAPAVTEHGLFNIHCYPYSADRSTIGVETDPDTWRRAGMDRWTEQTPAGESDKLSLAYLQDVFGAVLGGATLLGNRSRWSRFRTVSARAWSVGNVVLIGDAAHTAHYSVGSGTKMAMEDAVGLATALADPRLSLREALAAFETERRPRVERLQNLADRSRWWWESLEHRLYLPPPVLMLAYLSRGGAISAQRLADADPVLLHDALSAAGLTDRPVRASTLIDSVLRHPLDVGGRSFASRILPAEPAGYVVHELPVDITDPWGQQAVSLVTAVRRLGQQADVILLTGAPTRDALLDRLALAEHVRLHSPVPVAVEAAPAHAEDVVDAVIAGRIDLVRFTVPQSEECR